MPEPDLMTIYLKIKAEEQSRRIKQKKDEPKPRLQVQREYIWQRRAVDHAPLSIIAKELGCSLENVKGIWRRLKRATTITINPKDPTNVSK